METNQLPQVGTDTSKNIAPKGKLSDSQIELLRRTICRGADNDQMQLFLHMCKKTGLDPIAKQIYATMRENRKNGGYDMVIQTSIDGLRLVAARTGMYEGQVGPLWCGPDGEWRDVWLGTDPPFAAKVGVLRKTFREPLWAVAKFDEYAQTYKDQRTGELKLNNMWSKYPTVMIAKCAESLALRKAFPNELSGIHSSEEMGEAVPVQGNQRQSETPSDGFQLPPPTGESGANCPKRASDAQLKRLHAICHARGWNDPDLKTFLLIYLNINTSKDLHWKDYDSVCKAIEYLDKDKVMLQASGFMGKGTPETIQSRPMREPGEDFDTDGIDHGGEEKDVQ